MRWKEWVPTIGIVAIVAAAVVWQNQSSDPEGPVSRPSKEDRVRSCSRLAGTPNERLHACLDEVEPAHLSDEARELIEGIASKGKLFSLAALEGVKVEQFGLSDHPELEKVLMETDERELSRALRDLDVRGVVVHRDLTGALDRDKVVLARLAHHDFLEWFQLRYVTDELMVYTVRNSAVRVPIETGDRILRGLRERLEGNLMVHGQTWQPDAVRLIGTARLQGSTLVSRHVVAADAKAGSVVDVALDELADKMARDWERKVETKGTGSLKDRLDDLRLEVQIVMERAPVEPRSRFALFDLWEMGVDGMMFRQREPKPGEELEEKFTYLAGSELVTRSLHSADEFLRVAVQEAGWNDTRPWEKDTRTRLDLIRTQHFVESSPGGGPALRMVRGQPEVPIEWVTDRRVQDMLVAGGEWWLANQYPSGKFEYKYWPEQNRRSTDYNEVRHILAPRDLADTWRYRNDQRYIDGARRGMDWLMRYAVRSTDPADGPMPHPPAGTLLFRFPAYSEQTKTEPSVQKLGTVAVALLAWISWADATGSHEQDDVIRQMAEFVRSQQEADGRFHAYYVQPGHSYENERNDIVPGEAMLALGQVAEYFGEPEWVKAYDKFYEFYHPWFESRAKRIVPTGRWPQDIYDNQDRLDLVQFGPWSVMAAKQAHKLTGSEAAAKFGLEVADWMIDSYQWSEARSPWPDYVGGYYKLPEELPAMQTFCYSEGTAAAYTLAMRAAPERKAKYERATRESLRFLATMQFDELDSMFASRPEKIRGGIKYTMNEQKVRIDYVGHGLSTLSQWLDARREDPDVVKEFWDPTDLARPAGYRGSVPGLDYSGVPYEPPSGEIATAVTSAPGTDPDSGDEYGTDPGEIPVTAPAPEGSVKEKEKEDPTE